MAKRIPYRIPPIFHRYQWPFYWAMMDACYPIDICTWEWSDQEYADIEAAYCMGGEL